MTDATIFATDGDLDASTPAERPRQFLVLPSRSIGVPRWLRVLGGVANIGIYAGVALLAAGLVMLLATWGSTAGTTEVAAQVPRLVIGGIGGIAVVVIGLVVISATTRRQDADARMEQLADLRSALADLHDADAHTTGTDTPEASS